MAYWSLPDCSKVVDGRWGYITQAMRQAGRWGDYIGVGDLIRQGQRELVDPVREQSYQLCNQGRHHLIHQRFRAWFISLSSLSLVLSTYYCLLSSLLHHDSPTYPVLISSITLCVSLIFSQIGAFPPQIGVLLLLIAVITFTSPYYHEQQLWPGRWEGRTLGGVLAVGTAIAVAASDLSSEASPSVPVIMTT